MTAPADASPLAPAAVVLPWADHLDALEEWLRRSRDLIESGSEHLADLPGPASAPDGPLPAALRLRAATALQALQQVEQAAARRAVDLRHSQAYSRY